MIVNVFISNTSNYNVLLTVNTIIEIMKTPNIQTKNTMILPKIVIGKKSPQPTLYFIKKNKMKITCCHGDNNTPGRIQKIAEI